MIAKRTLIKYNLFIFMHREFFVEKWHQKAGSVINHKYYWDYLNSVSIGDRLRDHLMEHEL